MFSSVRRTAGSWEGLMFLSVFSVHLVLYSNQFYFYILDEEL